MSETLTYDRTADVLLEEGLQMTASESGEYGPETTDEWAIPLFSLVMANADVVKKWPWAGGSEVALGKSWDRPGIVTPENIDWLMLEISNLLASQPEEVEALAEEVGNEELTEENKTGDDETAKAEEASKPVLIKTDTSKVETGVPPPSRADVVEPVVPVATVAVATEQASRTAVESEIANNSMQANSSNVDMPEAPPDTAKTANSPSPELATAKGGSLAETTANIATSASAPETPSASGTDSSDMDTVEIAAKDSDYKVVSAEDLIIEEVRPETPEPVAEVDTVSDGQALSLEGASAADSSIETADPQASSGREVESVNFAAEGIAVDVESAMDMLNIDHESVVGLKDMSTTIVASDETIKPTDAPELKILEYRSADPEAVALVDNEQLLDTIEDVEAFDTPVAVEDFIPPEPIEQSPYGIENITPVTDVAGFAETEEIEPDHNHAKTDQALTVEPAEEPAILEPEQAPQIDPEQITQPKLHIEKAEETVVALVEKIEAVDLEKAEGVDELLDKLVEVVEEFRADGGENMLTETETQEELKELVIELFEQLEVEYDPELVESTVYFALNGDLTDKIKKIKDEETTEDALQGTGTHENIVNAVIGLDNFGGIVARACALGKSAIQLCAPQKVA